ncbi:unnamed protein product, partial [Mesorhabditis belari]|uniref:Uncharacterized protein n=1 Tax=Mesorhabditis belari TaxID=2138241 RepID=A0AAF3EMB0_9BILA
MDSKQFQDFLVNLSEVNSKVDQAQKGDEGVAIRRYLAKLSPNTLLCMQYIGLNYTDVGLVQPLISQILDLYMKGGTLKQFALQFIPDFIGTYLLALSKKQHRSASLFEAFFLSVYNEDIVVNPKVENSQKKVEEIRIPSVRYRSIYHDPSKIISLPEIASMRPGGNPGIQAVVQIGPFPAIDHFTAEKKFFILSRILSSVNSAMCATSEPVCRAMCLTSLAICNSGFSFAESNLRTRVLGMETVQEVLDDYSKRSRQHVSSNLLMELLNGCYLALYNGMPDLALRAIDAVHQRAKYEMLADVILLTNSIRNSLLENPLSKERREELMWRYHRAKERKIKDCVTNASLRMKKMPEDIPIQEDLNEKKSKGERIMDDFIEDIAEGVDHIKKKVSQLSHHHRKKHTPKKEGRGDFDKRNGLDLEELELTTMSTIREERGQSDSNISLSPSFATRPKKLVGESLKDAKQEVLDTTKNSNQKKANAKVDDELESPRLEENHKQNTVDETGSFSVGSFRHMDSGSGTERSVDF